MNSADAARRRGVVPALMLVVAMLMLGGVTAAGADPLQGVEQLRRIVIVARNDVPADALSAGPIAGALGGVILITPTGALSAPAHDALVQFAPDRVYIAGGSAAISAATEQAIDAAGPWDVVRKHGPTRDHTAAALATILDDLGVERPALSGQPQIIGDVHLGGTLHADSLTVQSADHVANLNADLLDGLDSGDFWQKTDAVDASSIATVVQVEETNSVQNAGANNVSVACPDGTMVTGGGGTFSSNKEWVLRVSTPVPDSSGWLVSYVPLDGNPGDSFVRVRAMCVPVAG